VHAISAREGADRQPFEQVMPTRVFDAAADAPGCVFRGGKSMIKSQHLLSSTASDDYLWLVEADESLEDADLFARVLRGMYEGSSRHREPRGVAGLLSVRCPGQLRRGVAERHRRTSHGGRTRQFHLIR
jgi:hypothetical protein